GANAKVKLINEAKACNVYWVVEGLVSMGSGTSMKGNIIANNAAITMNAGDTLEGRALSTNGAVTANNVLAYTPTGCGSPYLTGPAAPALGSTGCFALFSASGPVANTGITFLQGDVGTNSGLTTGFDSINVSGTIHLVPDTTTAHAAADLAVLYSYLNTLPHEIELLYPAQFGQNLVLTPHTYLLNAATALTDTLYLNAEGNADAVFVIKINGALSTSTFCRVVLTNGAQSKNVFWKVDGAVSISDFSVFRGTVVANNGALGPIGTGVVLDGRAFATTGAVTVTAITTTMAPVCATLGGGCDPVTNVTLSAVTTTSGVLNWTGSSSAVKYRVSMLNMTSGVQKLYFVNAPATTRLLQNLQPNTMYKIRVRAQCSTTGATLSSWTAPVYLTTLTAALAPCEAPANITSTVTSGTTATIAWTAVSGTSGYQLRYRPAGSLTWMPIASNTGTQSSASLTGLQAGTTYEYQMRTKCTLNPKTWSFYSSVYTFATSMRLGESDAVAFSLYPNPSNGTVNVSTNFTAGTITIYDAVGKTVSTLAVTNESAVTRLTGLPAGLLVYRFAANNGAVLNGRFAVIM
ncbi:MAG TPA: ice-binding family protein, partial [Chitinophagales bacterium]|nr:ice-binding family protein [Chitinophagales bacterium]